MNAKRGWSRKAIAHYLASVLAVILNIVFLSGCQTCELPASADKLSAIPDAMISCFSPDGHSCFSLTPDGKIVKTDLSTGAVSRFDCCSDFHACLKFSSDGDMLAAITANNSVFIWRQSKGEKRIVSVGPDKLMDLCIDDSMRIYCLSIYGDVSVISDSAVKLVATVEDCVGLLSVRTDVSSGVICDVLLGDGRLGKLRDFEWVKLIRIADVDIRLFEYSVQGEKVAVFTASSGIGKLQISDLSGLTIVCPEPPWDFEGLVISMAFSSDAKLVVLGTSGGDLMLIDATTGHELGRSTRYGNRIGALAFSNDNRLLAIEGTFRTVFCETEELFGDFRKK